MFHLILKHRKKIFLILPCCLLVILISFLSGNAFWSSLHAESSDRQFRTFTRSLFQTEVSANTISLHYTLRSPSDIKPACSGVWRGCLAGSFGSV